MKNQFEERIIVKGKSYVFAIGYTFLISTFLFLVFASKLDYFNTYGILLSAFLGLILEYLVLCRDYYKFYFFEDRIEKFYSLRLTRKREIITNNKIYKVIYIPGITRFTGTATLKIYFDEQKYIVIKIKDTKRIKLKKIVDQFVLYKIPIIANFQDDWLEQQLQNNYR